MLRIAGRRLSSLTSSSSRPISAAFASRVHDLRSDFSSAGTASSPNPLFCWNTEMGNRIRGFSSQALAPAHDIGIISDLPATVAAVKNPTSKFVYDEHNHELFPPGDPSKRAFAYFILSGGRIVYASLIRLLILKLVLSMSASKDVLALASLEVDLSSMEPGTTVTVKWCGKPVFIRRRTEVDIKLANSVEWALFGTPGGGR